MQVKIEDREIVIRLPISMIPTIVSGGWLAGALPFRLLVTNAYEFADDILFELRREREDGTTPVHELFDRVLIRAIENGARGVEILPDEVGK